MISHKITPFLWFDNKAQEAAEYYVNIFDNSKIWERSPMVTTFELEGQRLMALNGGPQYKFSEAISMMVSCADQREVDYYWKRLTTGGEESQCGWLKDKYGLSWQIVPTKLMELLGDKDPAKANRVMQAMLKMKKIIIADLVYAYENDKN
ncbi:MAG: VOC family protein [Microgenomates group bacterium]